MVGAYVAEDEGTGRWAAIPSSGGPSTGRWAAIPGSVGCITRDRVVSDHHYGYVIGCGLWIVLFVKYPKTGGAGRKGTPPVMRSFLCRYYEAHIRLQWAYYYTQLRWPPGYLTLG